MAEQKTFQTTPTGVATNEVCPAPGDTATDTLERQKNEARRQAEQIKAGARETAEEVRRKGAEMAREAKDTAREMKDRAMHSAAETAQQVQHRAMSLADEQKSRLASELTTFGAAMSRAADKLREDNDQRVASYADLAADQLRSSADYLNGRTCGELCGDVENFARRRPEVFFGGMLLVGLGIARFLKASRRPRQSMYGDEYDQFDDNYQQFGQGQIYRGQSGYGAGQQDRPTYAGGMYGQPSYGSSYDESYREERSFREPSDQDAFPESEEPAKGETKPGGSMNDPLSYH
jgi:hypothetical protein